MATSDELKRAAAEAALAEVPAGAVIGVGTGSTVVPFVDLLGGLPAERRVAGAVASSRATAERLGAVGVPLRELNSVPELVLYVDGADEIDADLAMIKGGGGALTREKILASASARFVCIADASKRVSRLGGRPVPVEVIPLAREVVARALGRLGGAPVLRAGFTTDNGNQILDVGGLDLADPVALERALAVIPGVVESGVFALRPADLLLLASDSGVQRFVRPG